MFEESSKHSLDNNKPRLNLQRIPIISNGGMINDDGKEKEEEGGEVEWSLKIITVVIKTHLKIHWATKGHLYMLTRLKEKGYFTANKTNGPKPYRPIRPISEANHKLRDKEF